MLCISKGNPIELNMKLNKKNNSDPRERIEETEEKVTQGRLNNEMDTERDKMTDEVDIPMDEEVAAMEEAGVTMEETHPVDKLEALQQKHDELYDSYLRLQAENDNFRKRTLKEKAELIKSGGERVLLETIALVDDFERALDSLHKTDDREALLEGMDLIYVKFVNFLKKHGVKQMEAIGQPFNGDRFEAVTTIPVSDESQKGLVVDCIQKGYEMNEKIIRYPKVIVGE